MLAAVEGLPADQDVTEYLINSALNGNQHKFIHGHYFSFSQNEMNDAIHYMIGRLLNSF